MKARHPRAGRRAIDRTAALALGLWLAPGAAPVADSVTEAGAAPGSYPAVVSDRPQGDTYAIDRHTIDGGGGRSSGGIYAIEGTIGQPDADPLQPSTGGVYSLTGGFWPGLVDAAPRPDALFANGFE